MASQLGARGWSRPQNVVVSVSPIVLLGRTLRPEDSSTTLATSQTLETSLASRSSETSLASRSSETSVASVTTTSDVTASPQIPLNNSRASEIGAGVGGSLGTALFLGLGAFLLKRYRRKRLHKLSQDNTLDKEEKSHGYDNKPELEGSEVRRKRLTKAELDALAIRAELEGSPGEEYGAGINVLKPELQGSQGIYGLVGIGVKKKAELEGSAAGGAGENLLEAGESASANGQPNRNDAGPVAELEAHDLPYKRYIGN
ncbi:hypothetical protein NUW58_g6172 [Xylaria curta]|uniref:Uncharacterized protein n=1 Tax=Xylaria curta TaxID=42375 RepID=A0ACC1NZQ5_9PEZI|nr:hypothetical protein NUW58_g6172 [Xylaria curta]